MRNVSSGFKTAVKKLGRELDVKIIKNGTELDRTLINRVSYSYEGQILKSVMKQLDLDISTSNYSPGDVLDLQIGIKVNGSFEYIDYGNFIVNKKEFIRDTNSWRLTCYDKMINTMKEYSSDNFDFSNYEFPMTIKEYIENLCDLVDILPPASATFANYNRTLESDPFLDINGKSLQYTARDIMDDIAEITGSIVCLNNDDRLVFKGGTRTNDSIDESYLKEDNVEFGESCGVITKLVVSRSAGADKIYKDNVYLYPAVDEGQERTIEIVDNQFMNGNDRVEYLDDIYTRLVALFNLTEQGGTGTPYRVYANYCDYSSTGILYYEIGDIYKVLGNYTIMLSDQIIIDLGLEEIIHADPPKEEQQDYTKMDTTDRRINQTYLIVDKQQGEITGLVSSVEEYKTLNDNRVLQVEKRTNSVETRMDSTQLTINSMKTDITNAQETTINSMVTINVNGINVSTNASTISTLINNERFVVMNGDTPLAFFGYDSQDQTTKSYVEHLTVNTYFIAGHHRVEKINIDGEDRTGWFYIG